jgi:L-ascorbate metabolism protein UlaG (beta-lactamase superfamily)
MTKAARTIRRIGTYRQRFFTSARHFGPTSKSLFDGKKFINTVPTTNWSAHVMKWLLNRKGCPWPKWIESTPGETPPERVYGTDLSVSFVNHSTVLIQTAGLNILTDPVWSPRVGPFPWLGAQRVRNPGLTVDQIPKLDLILVSHDHYDHLDLPSVKVFLQRDNPRLLTGLGVTRSLAIEGIKTGEALDWWQSVAITPDVHAIFTPSRHFSGRGLGDQDSTLWGSFVLTTPAGPIYFGGDTGYGPHFREIYDQFGPMTLSLLPIGCYQPRWFMKTFHMNPEDAVEAHVDLQSQWSVGIHLGTFRLGDEAYEQPAIDLLKALERKGLDPSCFTVPDFGQRLPLVVPRDY